MFKGEIHFYKNVDGKEEEIRREFDNEEEFGVFIDKNPELKKPGSSSKYEPILWPKLPGLNGFLEEAERLEGMRHLDEKWKTE